MAYLASNSAIGSAGSDAVSVSGSGFTGASYVLILLRVGGNSNSVTAPAGCQLVTTLNAAGGIFGGAQEFLLYYTTTISASYAFSIGGANGTTPSAIAVANTGRIVGIPTRFVATPYTGGSASPVSIPLTGLTAVAYDDILWMGSVTSTATGTPAWVTTPPSGYTSRQEASQTDSAGDGGTSCLATLDNASAGATGTLTGSSASSGKNGDYFGLVVALPVSPPVITAQPVEQTSVAGSTATFSLTATSPSGTTLSYQWYKNGSSIGGATSNSYTTPTLTSADNGNTYLCNVTDSVGTTVSVRVYLFLTGNPDTGKAFSDNLTGWFAARRGLNLRPHSDQLIGRSFLSSYDPSQAGRFTWLDWVGWTPPSGSTAFNAVNLSASLGAATLAGTGALGAASVSASIAAAQVAGLAAINASSLSASVAIATVTGGGSAGGSSLSASIGAATLVGIYAVGGASLDASIAAANVTGLGALGARSLSASIGAATVIGAAAIGAPSLSASLASAQVTGAYAIGGGSLDASIGAATLTGTGALGAPSLSATVAAASFTIIVPFTASSLSASLAVGNLTAPGAGAFSASTLAASLAAASVLGTGALNAASLSASAAAATVTGIAALGARSLSASIAAAAFTATYAIGGGSLSSSIAAASMTGKGALGGSGLSATLAAAQIVGIAPISARSLSATLATAQFIAASAGVISGRSLSATVAGAFIQALITPPNSRTIETVENHRFIVTRSGARLIATADSARVLPTRSVDRLLITGAGSSARTVTQ